MNSSVSKMIASGKIPHLLIFTCAATSDQKTIALEFAKELFSLGGQIKRDLYQYFPEGKSSLHSIEKMRGLCHELHLSSYVATYRCFVIYEAEKMLPTSANLLLKSFEEPPERCVILMLSSEPDKILSTLRSRAQIFYFTQSEVQELNGWQQKLLDILCGQRSLSQIAALGQELEKERVDQENRLVKGISKELPALQQKGQQKECEGIAATEFSKKVESLFQTILEVYRDREWLENGLDKNFLIHKTYSEQIAKVPYQKLSFVEMHLSRARLALQRHVKLSHCLEALLIVL